MPPSPPKHLDEAQQYDPGQRKPLNDDKDLSTACKAERPCQHRPQTNTQPAIVRHTGVRQTSRVSFMM